MSDQVEIRPQKNGVWRVSGDSTSYDTRSDAIRAARIVAEGRDVVLLRQDGSMYGALPGPQGTGGQAVSLEPAGESNDALGG